MSTSLRIHHKRHPRRKIVSFYASRHRVQIDLGTHTWYWEASA